MWRFDLVVTYFLLHLMPKDNVVNNVAKTKNWLTLTDTSTPRRKAVLKHSAGWAESEGRAWRQRGYWHLCLQMTGRCKLLQTGVDFLLWRAHRGEPAHIQTFMEIVMIKKIALWCIFVCIFIHVFSQCTSDTSAHDSVLRMCVCYFKDTSSRNSHFQNIRPDILPGNWFSRVNLYVHPHTLIYLCSSFWTALNCLQDVF